ncbi:MAG: DUF1614 domain-containing protein [Rhodocyclales bacterium]|nr:DUF1614 domain-containing protein [Rhodocyclales bacterium]
MPPLRLLLLVATTAFLVTIIQIGLLRVAFDKLGLSQDSAYLLLLVTLLGSLINLPLFTLDTDAAAQAPRLRAAPRLFMIRRMLAPGKTIIAVNVGGCVTPAAFSLYLFAQGQLDALPVVGAVAAVALLAYATSYSMPGVGIVMPILVAPVTAAFVAVMLDAEHGPALAYIAGTLGVLVGADLLRLRDVQKLGEPVASIGGAGTFDGIFITGIVAVLLA